MVTFNDKSFSIEVETGTFPADNYKLTVDEIISVLQATSAEMRGEDNYYYLLELLRAMMPDETQLKKLIA